MTPKNYKKIKICIILGTRPDYNNIEASRKPLNRKVGGKYR